MFQIVTKVESKPSTEGDTTPNQGPMKNRVIKKSVFSVPEEQPLIQINSNILHQDKIKPKLHGRKLNAENHKEIMNIAEEYKSTMIKSANKHHLLVPAGRRNVVDSSLNLPKVNTSSTLTTTPISSGFVRKKSNLHMQSDST